MTIAIDLFALFPLLRSSIRAKSLNLYLSMTFWINVLVATLVFYFSSSLAGAHFSKQQLSNIIVNATHNR